MSTEPVPVAILGSCISRDVFNTHFNAGYKQMWDCVLMQNQSSLISIMSPPYPIPEDQYADHMSDYQKLQVHNDTTREFLQKVVELQPAYLLVDFFGDVHFGVLEVGNGTYITNNRWMLWQTEWYKARKAQGDLRPLRIETDTEAYLALWEDALARLVEFVRINLPNTTVVVHRGRNAERWLGEGGGRPQSLMSRKKLFKIDVDLLNGFWRRFDEIACAVDGWEQIDLTDREYLSFKGHPWGVFYVHYTLDYYDEFLAALNAVHLSRVFGEGTTEAAMVSQMGEARRERHGELARLVSQVRRLQNRVANLRGQLGAANTQPRSFGRRVARRLRRR